VFLRACVCAVMTSTNPVERPQVLEYRAVPAQVRRASPRDVLVGVLCSLACIALCIWVVIAFVGGIAWSSSGHLFIGIILHLSAIVATPPACFAAEAAGALFSGKTARERA
jgi:hypothetical protein